MHNARASKACHIVVGFYESVRVVNSPDFIILLTHKLVSVQNFRKKTTKNFQETKKKFSKSENPKT